MISPERGTHGRSRHHVGRSRRPTAFTLIEMLVVITIITILVAITVPALSSARESARAATCKNNLRQFWIGLSTVADRTGRYGSGAFDWQRDGCPTEVGWVADLVGSGTLPGKMLCPSNQVQVSRTYADLLNGGNSFSPLSKSAGSPEGRNPDGTPKVNACRRILGSWSAGSAISPGAARRELVEKLIFLPGYNTNYCASWWLARSGVTLDPSGNVTSPGGHTPISTLERHCTLGPLMRAKLDSSGVASSVVPLLADAAATNDYLSDNLGDIPGGQPMGHAMTRGPVQPATMKPPSGISGSPAAAWGVWNATLQDYRQFGTPHARSCQIVFADGSVRAFIDETKDGLLNNGFPGAGTNGYTDATVELSPHDVFSRWRLSHE
ncbi:MAG TPA: prepilin-type N-terminal cleavage/methylation domain-containing protein [Pirellulales bacterium]|nr:prepilin-type N-terminal cleavage/methylation domain-containing protein [Pirellulales bacterium]